MTEMKDVLNDLHEQILHRAEANDRDLLLNEGVLALKDETTITIRAVSDASKGPFYQVDTEIDGHNAQFFVEKSVLEQAVPDAEDSSRFLLSVAHLITPFKREFADREIIENIRLLDISAVAKLPESMIAEISIDEIEHLVYLHGDGRFREKLSEAFPAAQDDEPREEEAEPQVPEFEIHYRICTAILRAGGAGAPQLSDGTALRLQRPTDTAIVVLEDRYAMQIQNDGADEWQVTALDALPEFWSDGMIVVESSRGTIDSQELSLIEPGMVIPPALHPGSDVELHDAAGIRAQGRVLRVADNDLLMIGGSEGTNDMAHQSDGPKANPKKHSR